MPDKPTHYKVVCHSMYTQDLDELERKVGVLKQHGWSRANRSHLIRIALSRLSDEELVAIAGEQRRTA
jgi:hypothetical protein